MTTAGGPVIDIPTTKPLVEVNPSIVVVVCVLPLSGTFGLALTGIPIVKPDVEDKPSTVVVA